MKYEKWMKKHLDSLDGKHVLVTGGNSGIGFEAARVYLFLGASVVIACRNEQRATEAVSRLRGEFPSAEIAYELVDLASFSSIDAFGARLKAKEKTFDICLHCAGVYYPREAYTRDGYPMTEGVNYIGTMRVADTVMPLMSQHGRMVFTTSLVDRFGRVDQLPEEEGYDAYCRSKTLLSAEIIRRASSCQEGRMSFTAAHPGITATNLLSPEKTTHKPFFSRLGHAFLYLFTHSPEKAALTAVLASDEKISNGAVVGPRGIFGISGYPHEVHFAPQPRRAAEQKVKTIAAEVHVGREV